MRQPTSVAALACVATFACLASCGSRTDLAVTAVGAASDASDAAAPASDAPDAPDAPAAEGGQGIDAPTHVREDSGNGSPGATALPECAPADGPAMQFVFATPAAACDGTPTGTYDTIELYRAPTGPTSVAFAPSGVNGMGTGQSCTGGVCASAVDVSLELTTFSGAGMSGTYAMTLTSGLTVSGTFRGMVCPATFPCG